MLTKQILTISNQNRPNQNKRNQTNYGLQEIAIGSYLCLKMADEIPAGKRPSREKTGQEKT